MGSTIITGWLFDVYPVDEGMRLWLIDREGRKHRLVDRFTPAFCVDGPPALLRRLLASLRRLKLPIDIDRSEGIEFYSGETLSLVRVRVAHPLDFARVVRWCVAFEQKVGQGGLAFYNFDLSLPQVYFFERGSFPLAFCEVEVEGPEGRVAGVRVDDSIWRTDYALPPPFDDDLADGGGVDPSRSDGRAAAGGPCRGDGPLPGGGG